MANKSSKNTKLEKRQPYRIAIEKGQSLVELALVILIVFLLVSGIVDLGRVLFYFQAMRDAAQEGAAYASAFPVNISDTDPPTASLNCVEIRNRIQANLPNDNIVTEISFRRDTDGAGIYYDCFTSPAESLSRACAPNSLKIVVRKTDFPIIMPVISLFVGQSIALETPITATIVQPFCK